MNITNKTVLITGGGSGIGFEIAKLLSQKGNKVIITGRTETKLEKAAAQLNNVSIIATDVNNETDVDSLERPHTEYGLPGECHVRSQWEYPHVSSQPGNGEFQ